MREMEYKKVRAGAVVRTNREIRNHYVSIPAGTEMTVTDKRNGFNLSGPACSCCGVRPFIHRVPWREVDLVRHAGEQA